MSDKRFFILSEEAKSLLRRTQEQIDKLKERKEKTAQSILDHQDMLTDNGLQIIGFGSFAFLAILLQVAQNAQNLRNLKELEDFSEEAKQFLHIQKERFDLVQKATKEGLDLKFDPQKDLKDFVNETGEFERSYFVSKILKNDGDIEKYINLSNNHKAWVENYKDNYTNYISRVNRVNRDEPKKERVKYDNI